MRTRSSISVPGLVGAVELVVDLDAVLVMDALEAGQVVVLDRVLVAEVEGDVDELVGRDQQAGLDDRDGPGAELGVEPVGQLVELGVAEPDEAGPGLGPLDLLGRLGGRGGLGFGGRRPAAAPRSAGRLAPRLGADHVDLARSPWAAGGRRGGGRGSARPPARAAARGSWPAWRSPASRASSSPCAVRSAAISTVRRSIRSGPEHRDRDVALDLVAIPGGEALLVQERDLQPLAVDLLLEHDQAVQEGLRRRRAAGDVDVDREVLVDARDDVVAFLERAAAGGAGAHRDHVLRLGHLVVEPGDHRHHRLGDGARDDHQVGLARRAAEDLGAEPRDVEPARRRADHLDRAAGQPEAQRPERRPPAPVVDRVDDPQQLVPVRDQDVLLQLLLEHRVDDRAPLRARDCRIRHDEIVCACMETGARAGRLGGVRSRRRGRLEIVRPTDGGGESSPDPDRFRASSQMSPILNGAVGFRQGGPSAREGGDQGGQVWRVLPRSPRPG